MAKYVHLIGTANQHSLYFEHNTNAGNIKTDAVYPSRKAAVRAARKLGYIPWRFADSTKGGVDSGLEYF